MATNLRSQAVRGVSWNVLSQVVSQGFTFCVGIVLARTLGPAAYGLIGMIAVFTGFAGIFGDLGLGTVVVQRKELQPRHLDAAFWVNVSVGALTTLVIAALGPVLANFYHEPRLVTLTIALSVSFVLDSFKVVQFALLNRRLQFKPIANMQMASTICGGLVGVGMALSGFGPWSLVAQSLSASTLSLVLVWYFAAWRPRFSFDAQAAKELVLVSKDVVGFNLLNYWARTLDNLLIGRFAGAAALGAYDKAYSLMLLPLSQVSRVVGNVMFPALSSIQLEVERVKRVYLRAIGIISLVTFPMMTGLYAVADHFVLALLGPEWNACIPILRIFCWVGILQSISTTTGWICLSQGKTRLYLMIGVIAAPIYMLGFLIGTQWGVMGISWAYLILNLIEWYPLWSYSGAVVNLSFREMLRALAAPFLCAVAMGVVVQVTGWLLPAEATHWMHLALQIPAGVLCYLALILGFELKSCQEARSMLGEVLPRPLERFRFLFQPASGR